MSCLISLGASCRTIRQEQCDETEDFLELFGGELTTIEGGRTASGFFSVEKTVFPVRLYALRAEGHRIHMDSVARDRESLDTRQVRA